MSESKTEQMASKALLLDRQSLRPLVLIVLMGSLLQGCATHSPERDAEHGGLVIPQDLVLGGEDHVLSGSDTVLSGRVDRSLGGQDTVYSYDMVLSGGDHALSAGDVWINSDSAYAHPNTDRVLNTENSIQWPGMKEVRKRGFSNEEMTALTVAVSRGAEDPNGLNVVQAKVDNTKGAVRNFCAKIHDKGLSEENNRYNVVFGIVESRVDDLPLVSIIDSGQRATVVCDGLGYISIGGGS